MTENCHILADRVSELTREVNCDEPINILFLRFCAHLSLNSHWHWTSNETYLQEVVVLCHVSLIWFCWEWKSDTSMYSSSFPTETYLIHIWKLLTWFSRTWFPQKQNWQSNTSSHLQDEVPQQALFNTYNNVIFSLLSFPNSHWLLKKNDDEYAVISLAHQG